MTVPSEREDLWHRLKTSGDAVSREQLIVSYLPLVRYVAGRVSIGLPPHIEGADLESYGIFGLIDALEKFDPGRGFKFETYAIARIRGAIIDGLRSESWAPQLRQRAKALENAYVSLQNRLGRVPLDSEMAGFLGCSLEELARREAELGALSVLSLDDVWGDSGEDNSRTLGEKLVDEHTPDPFGTAVGRELGQILGEAIERLPEKEKLVVTLYYYEGLTAKEISQVMGLSAARISQLHSKAILRLRGRLSRFKASLLA